MSDKTERSRPGDAFATTLHVVLLLAVLAQVVYLASRHRVRVDLTSDQLWTSTESTRNPLGQLRQRLVIEAYFSPKEKLPVNIRETRAWADSFLDELVQLGKGRVVVRRLDPNSDKAIADKATRVGVKPVDLQQRTSTALSVDRHWQGLRLLYGAAGKQRVIPQFAPPSSFFAEAMVTPAIKEVLTQQKRKIGYMEWPATSPGGPQQGGIGWNALRTNESIGKRYEFQNLKDEDGALLPADLETLFLFRPKDLTDRQKYVLDQFVVRGGTLVAFVDAAEYLIGPNRNFTKLPMAVDAAGSTHKFTEQLLHYGLDWKQKVLADMADRAHAALQAPQEYFALPQQGGFARPVAYPYFFHALNQDWAAAADALAKDPVTGQVDRALADQYRKQFLPGMPSDEFLFKAFKGVNRGPGMYWPTWVGLRERAGGVADLPDGVRGRVLLRSSPLALAEDPPQSLNPLGFGDMPAKEAEYRKFRTRLAERTRAEPRQQAPLMVEVEGRFTSFFAGQDRPKRPSEVKEEEAKKAAAAAKEAEAKDEAAQADPSKPDASKPDPSKPDPAAGPQPPRPDAAAAQDQPAEAAMVTQGERDGRILLVGDSDFLRDDLVGQQYYQAGGPVSVLAQSFFVQMLDWLAEDSDLVALQSKSAVDRTIRLVDGDVAPTADPRLQEQALRRKTTWLRAINVLAPAALLAALGLGVFFVRRAQKRTFLTSLS